MSNSQLTSFEIALLSAVEELNTTFETGLKSVSVSPIEFASLKREFNRFMSELEKRLDSLQKEQDELRRMLAHG